MLAKHSTHQQSSDPLAGFTPEQLLKISEMALSRAKEAKEAQTSGMPSLNSWNQSAVKCSGHIRK